MSNSNGYIAFYNGNQTEIYAESKYAAVLKAEAYFKPKKKDAHMISVVLAEIDGEQVTHTPDF